MVHTKFESYDDSVELHDALELINFTLSNKFKEKWAFKYSESFIRLFQERFLESLNAQKPLKKSVLTKFLVEKHKYNITQVEDFYKSIELENYYPIIQ